MHNAQEPKGPFSGRNESTAKCWSSLAEFMQTRGWRLGQQDVCRSVGLIAVVVADIQLRLKLTVPKSSKPAAQHGIDAALDLQSEDRRRPTASYNPSAHPERYKNGAAVLPCCRAAWRLRGLQLRPQAQLLWTLPSQQPKLNRTALLCLALLMPTCPSFAMPLFPSRFVQYLLNRDVFHSRPALVSPPLFVKRIEQNDSICRIIRKRSYSFMNENTFGPFAANNLHLVCMIFLTEASGFNARSEGGRWKIRRALCVEHYVEFVTFFW